MTKLLGYISLVLGTSIAAMASDGVVAPVAPEINAGTAGTALALLSGGLLLLRARRKK